MLVVLFSCLFVMCLHSSQMRLSPQIREYLSGLECMQITSESDCLLITDTDGNYRCRWERVKEDFDCSPLYPKPIDLAAAEGCCRGFSFKSQDECMAFEDELSCETAYCDWVITENPDDCMITTTTSPTTTTASEQYAGCCKGDAPETNDKCNERTDSSLCDSDDKCEWMVGSDPDLCVFDATESDSTTTTTTVAYATDATAPAATSTCCYPDQDNGGKWKDRCTSIHIEQECLEVSNYALGGNLRCRWNSNCATTTTSAAPGCCFGLTYRMQSKCEDHMDQRSCEQKRCTWLLTEDPSDCVITTTASPTTTQEPGCCAGDNERRNKLCNAKSSRKTCERAGSCVWQSGEDADCEWIAEEGCCASTNKFMVDRCSRMSTKESCDATPKCEFKVNATDCSWPTEPTTDAPYPTEEESTTVAPTTQAETDAPSTTEEGSAYATSTTDVSTTASWTTTAATDAPWTTEAATDSAWTTANDSAEDESSDMPWSSEAETDEPWLTDTEAMSTTSESYRGARHQGRYRRDGSVLFDEIEASVMSRSLDLGMPLTSLLLSALLALIAYAIVYAWRYNREEYTKILDQRVANGQAQHRYESA